LVTESSVFYIIKKDVCRVMSLTENQRFMFKLFYIFISVLVIVIAGCLSEQVKGKTVNIKGSNSLHYQAMNSVYIVGKIITPNIVSPICVNKTIFTVNPPLPSGLSLNPATGTISGTPRAVQQSTSYLITASNSDGCVFGTIFIIVNDSPPSGLVYSVSSIVYLDNIAITDITPTVTGTVDSWSVWPSLPDGLRLNTTTGIISGVPKAHQHAADYIITASNSGGSTCTSMSLAICGMLHIAGKVTTLAGFHHVHERNGIGSAADFRNPAGITTDGINLYVTDWYNNEIRKIDLASKEVTTLAGSTVSGYTDGVGSSASFNLPAGITTDGVCLYVADTYNCEIRKVVIATGEVLTIAGSYPTQGHADGQGAAARFNLPYGIATDGINLYVTELCNNDIRKISIATGEVTTLAGSLISESEDGIGSKAGFSSPTGITTDGINLYVADTNNNEIRKIVIATGEVTTISGSSDSGDDDGISGEISFNHPMGIATDGNNLYISDSSNNKIRKMELFSGNVITVAGSVLNGNEDGTGTHAAFYHPEGLTVHGNTLYIADSFNDTIRKVSMSTDTVSTIAGSNSEVMDGTGSSAGFNQPDGITTDGNNLYVADSCNSEIRKIRIATGVVTTLAGKVNEKNNEVVNQPSGITTDGQSLYFVDRVNNKIGKIVILTGVVSVFAGSGMQGHDDGIGCIASFNRPSGITTDGVNLYIADSDNNEIRKIVIATGKVTTFAGSTSIGSVNGIGTNARFSHPVGITTDYTYLYISDSNNNEIRKISLKSGAVTTIAGSTIAGHEDGTGTAAGFNQPYGITTDGTILYVVDKGNNEIRKIEIATGRASTIAGSTISGSADGIGSAARFNRPAGITTDGINLYVSDLYNNEIRMIQ